MEQPPAEIVGVVGDVRDGALNREPNPIMDIPWAQLPDAHSANLLSITSIAWVVRTRAEPFSLSETIQKQLREASGGLPSRGCARWRMSSRNRPPARISTCCS